MSQEELAANAQVSRGSIQNWEGDHRVPRRAEFGRLAAALGRTVAEVKEIAVGDGALAEAPPDTVEPTDGDADPLDELIHLREMLQAALDRIDQIQRRSG